MCTVGSREPESPEQPALHGGSFLHCSLPAQLVSQHSGEAVHSFMEEYVVESVTDYLFFPPNKQFKISKECMGR